MTTGRLASGIRRDEVPSEPLALARLLLADARAGIERSADPGLHLDLAVADLEFADALGEPLPAGADLRRAVELVGDRKPEPWLYRGGAAQFGWVTARTAGRGGGPLPDLARWDDVVARAIAAFPADRDVDLPLGLLGLGVHALAHPEQRTREELLGGILDVIEARAEHDVDGIFVRLVDAPHRRADGSAGLVLLGVAHGIAGLVSFLASVAAAGLACSGRTHPLLGAAVRWLLRQRVNAGRDGVSRWVRTGYQPHRLTWCYGDPGIALALSVAAEATGSAAIAAAAQEIATTALARPPSDAGVVDAALCHGAAGLVWFGHRTRLRTGDAAAHRFTETWTAYVAEQRAAGPLHYLRPDGMRPDHSFLEGDLGVALALLHLAADTPPAWEQLLLGTRIEPATKR